jgi:hypothetical protein
MMLYCPHMDERHGLTAGDVRVEWTSSDKFLAGQELCGVLFTLLSLGAQALATESSS